MMDTTKVLETKVLELNESEVTILVFALDALSAALAINRAYALHREGREQERQEEIAAQRAVVALRDRVEEMLP